MKIRDTMPRNTPGTISEEVKIEILAYLLQQNGFPAGSAALKADLPALDELRVTRKGVWDGVFTAAQADRGKAAAGTGPLHRVSRYRSLAAPSARRRSRGRPSWQTGKTAR